MHMHKAMHIRKTNPSPSEFQHYEGKCPWLCPPLSKKWVSIFKINCFLLQNQKYVFVHVWVYELAPRWLATQPAYNVVGQSNSTECSHHYRMNDRLHYSIIPTRTHALCTNMVTVEIRLWCLPASSNTHIESLSLHCDTGRRYPCTVVSMHWARAVAPNDPLHAMILYIWYIW